MLPPISSRPAANEASARVVLIADDDEEQRELLREVFLDAGFAVEAYADGDQLLRALTSRYDALGSPPELIVTDVRMPGPDGLEVIARLRDFDRMTRVIVVTGHATVETRLAAASLDAEVMQKPLLPDELRRAVFGDHRG